MDCSRVIASTDDAALRVLAIRGCPVVAAHCGNRAAHWLAALPRPFGRENASARLAASPLERRMPCAAVGCAGKVFPVSITSLLTCSEQEYPICRLSWPPATAY